MKKYCKDRQISRTLLHYYITRTHRRIIAGQTGLIVTDLCLAFSLTQEGGGGGEVRDERQGSTLFRTPRAASYQQVRSLGVYFSKTSYQSYHHHYRGQLSLNHNGGR